jgi:TonB family protein
MGYQALLFCPDEKLARVVSQVFSELDFTVEPVHEPFAAVKKLMARRYDAIVVDCENEQNAALLFKSARNSSFNQSSLGIAVVEGQAGVAKAYRIGANLVLTKPINVEQAKGTLRVARGLLRKNSDNATASVNTASALVPALPTRTAPASSSSSFEPASRGPAAAAPFSRPELPKFEPPLQAEFPLTTASARVAENVDDKVDDRPSVGPVPNDLVKTEAANIGTVSMAVQNPHSTIQSMNASAAAPAPAKEVPAPPTGENRTLVSDPLGPFQANPSHDAAPIPIPNFGSANVSDVPSFGILHQEDSGGSGTRKIMITAVAVLVLAVTGYLGYGKFGKSATTPAQQPVSAAQSSGQTAPTALPMSAPVETPSNAIPGRGSSATQILTAKTATAPSFGKSSTSAGNPPAIRIAADIAASSETGTKAKTSDAAPIVVRSSSAGSKLQTQTEESAPPISSQLAVPSVDDSKLSGLMSSASPNISKPSLATLRVSQGVSQGLVIKRVQPKYPPAALATHTQGAVQIEATINKEGSVINPKVLSGDPVLAHAAVEAVRQWRYKPYYLDGEPVEIQTQITVSFKAN